MKKPKDASQKPADISEFLEQSDMTQKELADRLGISQPYLSQLINGERQPSLDLAALIEDVTGVPMRSLSKAVNQ